MTTIAPFIQPITLVNTDGTPASASGMSIGGTVTDGTAGSILFLGAAGVLAQDNTNFKWGTTAGQGLTLGAGTATTDVAALSITQTWNNALCATGVKIAITDTTSAAGALPFQVLGGAAATTALFSVRKAGGINVPAGAYTAPAITFAGGADGIYRPAAGTLILTNGATDYACWGKTVGISVQAALMHGWSSGDAQITMDTAFSRISAGVIGVGTGAAASVAGTISAKYHLASVGDALTAAGTTRTDALQLAATTNNITTAAAGTGVILPVGSVGMAIVVFNAGANLVQVYASASETIDGTAGSTGVALTNAKRCIYYFTVANTWISAQLGAVSA